MGKWLLQGLFLRPGKDLNKTEFMLPNWLDVVGLLIVKPFFFFFFFFSLPLNRLLWLEIQFAYLCNAVRQIKAFIICWILLYSNLLKQLPLQLSFKLKVTDSSQLICGFYDSKKMDSQLWHKGSISIATDISRKLVITKPSEFDYQKFIRGLQ